MILSCSNIEKSFDGETIISKCSFVINAHEKVGIVGINGAGKSTLLKIIVQELEADRGEVIIAKDTTLGYLAQHQDIFSENTVYEELLTMKADILALERQMRSLELQMKNQDRDKLEETLKRYTDLTHEFELQNGYAYKSEVTGILKGLGFLEEEFQKPVKSLSGGQKTRLALCKLLVSKPDVILLDEPTNHLDISSIRWLEGYLSNYSGTVVIVSHDRYFLDRIVGKIIELDLGEVAVFTGNYSAYAQKKAMLRDAKLKQYMNQQQEIKHQEAVIAKLKSFNREKSIKRAESRQKMLDKIEVLDKPVTESQTMRFSLEPQVISGKDVLSVEDLSKSFGTQILFDHLNFEIKRGERVAIIGNNGTGKTTLLKIINRLLPPDRGTITVGAKVFIGYYDQEHHELNMNNSVFDEIADAYPTLGNTKIRNVLAAFLFTGDDVFKKIGELSGGERGRVSLAKLMLSESNFLILDEPTNHLDIDSKEILEDALNDYTGTVLYVSHDRYFINRTATRILNLENKSFTQYLGNYDYYLEKQKETGSVSGNTKKEETVSASKEDWKIQKELQAQKRKLENEIKKAETKIEEMESKIDLLNEELTKEEVYSSPSRCLEVQKEISSLEKHLKETYDLWERLSSQSEST